MQDDRRRRRVSGVLVLLLAGTAVLGSGGRLGAQERSEWGDPVEPGWSEAGTFSGARASSFADHVNNLFFEEERGGGLYEDLGDLSIGLDAGGGDLTAEWENSFRRRVLAAHAPLPAGAELTPQDTSTYQVVKVGLSRLRVDYDYLPDLVGSVDVGAQVEGGYALGTAERQEPLTYPADRRLIEVVRGSVSEELRDFYREHGVDSESSLFRLVLGGGAGLVDLLAGLLGEAFVDTERGAIYFEDFAEALTLFFDLGLPVEAELFRADNPRLAVGDRLSFTTFIGVSPIRAGIRRFAVETRYRHFYRYLRETTVEKLPDDQVLVRVRNSLLAGDERIPLKVRPEVRLLLIFKLGYTFFDTQSLSFGEVASELVYRFDLADPEGLRGFRQLLGDGMRVQPRAALSVAQSRQGGEIVHTEYRNGQKKDDRFRTKLFSWFRYRRERLSSVQQVERDGKELTEAVESRVWRYEKRLGRDRSSRAGLVVAAVAGSEALERAPLSRDLSVVVESTFSSRQARAADLRRLGASAAEILSMREPHPILEDLSKAEEDGSTRAALQVSLAFGPEQLRRLAAVDEETLWRELAALLLGEEYRQLWDSPAKRYLWMPVERAHGRPVPRGWHVSRRFDQQLGERRAVVRGLGFSQVEVDSRSLFDRAWHLAHAFERLQRRLSEAGIEECLECVSRLFTAGSDLVLLQGLLVRLAGGVESGEVGYRMEVFTDKLLRPVVESNELASTFATQSALADLGLARGRTALFGSLEAQRDADARLRAGRMMVRTTEPEPGELDAGCWKLRLYSDLLFSDQLVLRASLRKSRFAADAVKDVLLLDLGEPEALPPTPFRVAGYFYEVPLPWIEGLEPGASYTLLLRLLNPAAVPVSEEQELRLKLPIQWSRERCGAPPLEPAGAEASPAG